MNRILINRSAGRLWLLLLLLQLPVSGITETTIYQWRDASGNEVFSDLPRSGAEKITIPDPSTYTPIVPPVVTARQPAQEKQTAPLYQTLTLVEPQPESTIWSNPGNFQVHYEVKPALRTKEGDRLVIMLDDEARPAIAGTRYYFENINRGAHTLKGRIINADGNVLVESESATIYLQQQSLNYPAR